MERRDDDSRGAGRSGGGEGVGGLKRVEEGCGRKGRGELHTLPSTMETSSLVSITAVGQQVPQKTLWGPQSLPPSAAPLEGESP